MKSLAELASKYGTDKQYDNHNYVGMYDYWLGKLHINKMLEIGFGSGASAKMWLEYLPDAEVYIMEFGDEEFKEKWNNPNIELSDLNVVMGDSRKQESWDQIPNGLDFIVDDGSHFPEDQIATFELGFGKLREHGLYFIEDTHCGFQKEYGGKPTIYQYFLDLMMEQQLPQYNTEGDFYKYLPYMKGRAKEIFSYHFYKSIILLEKA
jgi:hypothetical protein